MFTLVTRNIRIFLTDKAAVFFSILGAMIAILLIQFFLKSSIIDSMVADFTGRANRTDAEHLLDAWLIASACVIASGTTGLGALGIFVQDRETARWRDFLVTPAPRWSITGGYVVSAGIISMTLTTIVFLAGTTYCWLHRVPLNMGGLLESWVWLMVSSLAFTSLMSMVVSLLKTQGSFAGFSIIIGTGFGFFAQTYVTASVLPTDVRNLLSSLPFAQASSLVRKPYTYEAISALPEILREPTMEAMGITLHIGSTSVTTGMITSVLIAMIVVFSIISWQIMARTVKT